MTHPAHPMHPVHPAHPSFGTNGLTTRGPWPQPSTGALDLDSFKAWMAKDNETLASTLKVQVKNEYLVIGGVVLGGLGLAWYGHKKRWF